MLPWTAPFIVPTPEDEKIKQKAGSTIGATHKGEHILPAATVAPKGLRISSAQGKLEASIDGFDLGKTCSSLSLEMGTGGRATVSIDLEVRNHGIFIEGAVLKIGGMEAGETVERAVLDFLMAKYDVKPMKGKCTMEVLTESGAGRETAFQSGKITSTSSSLTEEQKEGLRSMWKKD